MPHQCTACGHTFPDGSKEMLAGCPSCGGKKFQFLPAGSQNEITEPATTEGSASELQPRTGAIGDESSAAGRDEQASSAGDDPVTDDGSQMSWAGDETSTGEDSAQAAARSTVISRDELPESGDGGSPPVREEKPADLDALRTELNEQFESIKILEPGQYELNLMELFDRDERIIAIEEDGRYVIDVPEEWRNDG